MKHLIFFLLLVFPLFAFPQGGSKALPLPDSLAGKLKEHRKTDVARAEALEAAIMFYYDEHRILEALPYINELESLAYDLKDSYYIVLSKYYTGLYELENNNFTESIIILNDALKYAETLRMTDHVRLLSARIYLAKSSYYHNKNMFPEEYESIQKGLDVLDKTQTKERSHLLNNLGTIFCEMGNFDEGIRVFRDALERDKKSNKRSIYYANIAAAYNGKTCYDSALIYADSALRISTSMYDTVLIMHFKATTYISLMEPDTAEQLYEKCLERTQFHQRSYLYLNSLIYQNLGCIAINKGDFQKALHFAEEASLISDSLQNDNRILECIKFKAEVLDSMGDYENAMKYMSEYNTIRDIVLMNQNKDRVNEAIHQKEIRMMKQQYELQRQASRQRQMIFIVLAVVIVIIGALVAIMIWLNRKRLAAELELRNREITAKSMGKMQSNEILNDIIEKLSEMESHPEKNILPSVIRDLKTLVDVDTKKDFDLHFVQMHPDFYQKLLTDFPKLTQNELRLCAFIKSNLSIKEIAAINGISAESVKTARKRLRKSLNLTGEDVSLLEFLSKY